MTWRQWLSCSLAAGMTLFLVGAGFYLLVPFIAPGIPPQFLNCALFRPWPGWTSTYMALHPFGYGIVFATVFLALRRWSQFPPGIRGGFIYGAGVFVVGSLPVYLLAFASFQVSPEVIVSWIVQSLTQYGCAGMAIGCVADGVTVRVSVRLPAPAERVWELLLRKDTFLYITRGMLGFADTDRWPETLFSAGAIICTRVRMFNWGPAFGHEVRVVRVDESKREIDTEERGTLITVWNHRLHVEPVSDSECCYTDRIELRAGLLTPLVWVFASAFYRFRQRRWKKLLSECGFTAS
jgi:hypothetical protein